MKEPAKSKEVTVKLPFMDVEWETDVEEQKALRNLVDQIRSRRALEISRCTAQEMPQHFLQSIIESRSEIRELMKSLPLSAKNSRLSFLHVVDLLAAILDEWHKCTLENFGDQRAFDLLNNFNKMHVMNAAWPKIETIRKEIDDITSILESQLDLRPKE